MTALSDSQLMTLLLQAPLLDRVMPALPEALQQQFLDLEVRAAHAYNAGTWAVIKSPSPLEGEGGVGGLSPRSHMLINSPLPNPPPQGGREVETFTNPPAEKPTREETQQLLGTTYMALDGHDYERRQLRSVMDALELMPSARRKNVVEQVMDTVKGWFR